MKRILALSLSAALLLAALCACTGGVEPEDTMAPSDPAGASAAVPSQDTTQEPSLALPSEEPSEEIPTEPSDEPTAEPSAEPSQEPSQAPATQAPATQPPETQTPATQPPETQPPESPDPSPTVPGGGIVIPGLGGPGGGNTDPAPSSSQPTGGDAYEPTGPTASDVDLTDFSNTVLGGDYGFPGMMELNADWITDMFPGLTAIPVVQRIVSVPMMSGQAAALVLVQVTDSDHVSAVKAILQDHVDIQIARNSNYIAVVESYQKNSRIVSSGNYVMLIVHSECDAIVADFNALF